jgi:DNA replication protein DnaC
MRKPKVYTEPTLLLVDELGYLSLDQQTSKLFYQVISTGRSQKRSTIITTTSRFPTGATSSSTPPLPLRSPIVW